MNSIPNSNNDPDEAPNNETGSPGNGGRETGGRETGGRETGGRETGGRETGGRETGGRETGGWESLGEGADALKAAMRHFPSGVTVITSGSGEKAEGMTANAVLSVSLEPPLMLASVHKDARLNARIKEEKHFAISILADDQEGHSRLFSSPERSSGTRAVHSLGDDRGGNGPPLASGAIAAIECELTATYPGGDHELFLGRVAAVHLGDTRKNPLLYHGGEYPKLKKGDSPNDNRAFMDSPRGYDARIQNFQKRRRK